MWLRHWNLTHNPFDGHRSPFVATPTHAEAVARLVHTVEESGRSADLTAKAGLGKSLVLARVMALTRRADRKLALVTSPSDGPSLFASLASSLGVRVARDPSRAVAWRALTEATRLSRWQGLQVVLAVDDCQALHDPTDRLDLARLDHLDPDPRTRLTILRAGRPVPDLDPEPSNEWRLAIRLVALTRSEVTSYVETKLDVAGRTQTTFTPSALTRLHALSSGIPRAIDRLTTLALMASAVQGLEVVSPEILDGSSLECLTPAVY